MIWSFRYWIDSYRTSQQPIVRTNYLTDSAVRNKTEFLIADPFSLKKKHGVTDTNLLNLAGGIPISKFADAYCRGYSVNEDVFKTEVQYHFGKDYSSGVALYGRVMRTIDFKKMQIFNDEVQLQKKGTGFGTRLFINQVNEARKRCFLTLKMHAAGGADYPPDSIWDGYKVWAKYGYRMVPYYQNKYDSWRKNQRLNQKSLNKLYWSRYYSFWEKTGFSWDGTFDLAEESESMIYLKRYLASKKINVELSPFGSP